ncbi:MAG: hypothetical protein KF833_12105 [Verrucomicrobiae bacterium]|nr:hypothetical protein [Verrucomicrobiae bacterium]
MTRERGRFRAFLSGALNHFLANDWHRLRRQQRGGHKAILSLDSLLPAAEERFLATPDDGVPPEVAFDREWAGALLQSVLRTLRHEAPNPTHFEAIKGFLSREGGGEAYRAAAAALGVTDGVVKVAVHRLRRRFQEVLRRRIAETVGPAGDVEDELRHLVETVRSHPETMRS